MDFTDLIPLVQNIKIFDNQYVLIENRTDYNQTELFCQKIRDKIKNFSTSKVIYLIENFKHWSNTTAGSGYIADFLYRNNLNVISCIMMDEHSFFTNPQVIASEVDMLKKLLEHIDKHEYPYLLINYMKNSFVSEFGCMSVPEADLIRMIQSVLNYSTSNELTLAKKISLAKSKFFKSYTRFLRCEEIETKKIIYDEFIQELFKIKNLLKSFCKIFTLWKMMHYLHQNPKKIIIFQGSTELTQQVLQLLKFRRNTSKPLSMFNHL